MKRVVDLPWRVGEEETVRQGGSDQEDGLADNAESRIAIWQRESKERCGMKALSRRLQADFRTGMPGYPCRPT
jgi:hypothetical protein